MMEMVFNVNKQLWQTSRQQSFKHAVLNASLTDETMKARGSAAVVLRKKPLQELAPES